MKTVRILRSAVALFSVLALVSVLGCSTTQPGHQTVDGEHSEGMVVMVDGLLPPWDLGDMVKQSDAIVMGVLKSEIGTKTAPGGANDPPRFSYEFTDYEVRVERVFYPKDGLPGTIAVLAETGAVPAGETDHVVTSDEIPVYAEGDKVILFLRSLAEYEKSSEGVGRPVPEPFGAEDYFRALVGREFGKMQNNGAEWEDSRSGKTFTVSQLEEAVEDNKDD